MFFASTSNHSSRLLYGLYTLMSHTFDSSNLFPKQSLTRWISDLYPFRFTTTFHWLAPPNLLNNFFSFSPSLLCTGSPFISLTDLRLISEDFRVVRFGGNLTATLSLSPLNLLPATVGPVRPARAPRVWAHPARLPRPTAPDPPGQLRPGASRECGVGRAEGGLPGLLGPRLFLSPE